MPEHKKLWFFVCLEAFFLLQQNQKKKKKEIIDYKLTNKK